jgi:hypothetical protein
MVTIAQLKLGFGKASAVIPEIVNELGCNLVVMAPHGHGGIKDLLFGTTLEKVRHRISVPLNDCRLIRFNKLVCFERQVFFIITFF